MRFNLGTLLMLASFFVRVENLNVKFSLLPRNKNETTSLLKCSWTYNANEVPIKAFFYKDDNQYYECFIQMLVNICLAKENTSSRFSYEYRKEERSIFVYIDKIVPYEMNSYVCTVKLRDGTLSSEKLSIEEGATPTSVTSVPREETILSSQTLSATPTSVYSAPRKTFGATPTSVSSVPREETILSSQSLAGATPTIVSSVPREETILYSQTLGAAPTSVSSTPIGESTTLSSETKSILYAVGSFGAALVLFIVFLVVRKCGTKKRTTINVA